VSQPPSPPRRLQKVHLGKAGPSRHRLTCRVSEQSSRTTPKASSAPRHRHGPRRTAARPSWTPAHIDHRLVPPNRHVPNLSRYIRDKVGPRRERILDRSPDTLFHSICLRSAPHREQGNPKRGTESSSSASHRLPPLRRGEGSTSGEMTLGSALSDSLPNLSLSLLHSVVTPRFWVLLSIKIINCWT